MLSTYRKTSILFLAITFWCLNAYGQSGKDWTGSERFEFSSDGVWSWFQDERAVIDTTKEKLIVGSANMRNGVNIVIFDLPTKTVDDSIKFSRLRYSDDFNAPALLILPDDNYLAMWAHHYDSIHRYSIYRNGNWSNERFVQWSQWGYVSDCRVAFTNLYYLSDENRIYNVSRVFDRAPNFIYSDDNGESWKYGGQLTTSSRVTNNKGYYKYWGNGKDRIDMVFTEEHPRDLNTSIYHGYLQDHKTFNSDGKSADDDIYNNDNIPNFYKFTKVFESGTKVDGIDMGRCWQHDIARYDDGTIVILFKARANNSMDDHRNFYARYSGTEWKWTYIGKAGKRFYGNEHDYTGLGAVNPDDPNRIYISSAYNPGDDHASRSAKRELWRGTTSDSGATWEWEPVTANSSRDNTRPIIPKWQRGKEALLWCSGDMITASTLQCKIVGMFFEYDAPPVKCAGRRTSSMIIPQGIYRCSVTRQAAHRIVFSVDMPEHSPVTIQIFSVSGEKVASLFSNSTGLYRHKITWNSQGIPTGFYIARVTAGTARFSKHLVLY